MIGANSGNRISGRKRRLDFLVSSQQDTLRARRTALAHRSPGTKSDDLVRREWRRLSWFIIAEHQLPGALRFLNDLRLSDLLEALDGVVYLAAADGTILMTNRSQWIAWASAGGAPGLTPDSVCGRSLFAMIVGDDVRAVARRMHEAVIEAPDNGVVSYTFRCDAPAVERRMRMSLTALSLNNEPVGVLYQSILLSENARAPISLFEPVAMGAYFDQERAKPMVTLCSYCQSVAWPIGAVSKDRDWIDPTDYYRRGGPNEARVSHGICPSCYSSLVIDKFGHIEDL